MKDYAEAERGFPAFLTLSWAWQESLEDPAAVRAALARNLRHHRGRRSLSRKALGQASSVSLAAIRDIESGHSLPDIPTLSRLADALDVSCSVLVECGVSMETAHSRRILAKAPDRETRTALA
jgi:transcriptional regulator with XRE-family HTH domain